MQSRAVHAPAREEQLVADDREKSFELLGRRHARELERESGRQRRTRRIERQCDLAAGRPTVDRIVRHRAGVAARRSA